MFRKKIALLFVLFGLLTSSLYAQNNPYGVPSIRNYHFAQTGGSEQNWCITQDHRGVIYVGNNDNGILEFDGSSWRTIPVPNEVIVRSLITGENGVVYAGLEGDFGRLEPDYKGELHFRSLLDSLTKESYPDISIWKTYYEDSKVYFCSMEAIFVFDPASQEMAVIDTPEFSFLSYFINSELYTTNFKSGLMRYDGDDFFPIPGAEFFREINVSGMLAMGPDHLIVGTFNRGLFLLNLNDGSVDSTFTDPALMEDLASTMLVNLTRDENHIYLGTMDNGLIVLDTLGEIVESFSEEQGMLDNTVAQVYLGAQGWGGQSIWIAHFKGISRVDLNSPFRMQSIGPRSMGMDGRGQGEMITDMVEFGEEIFVSTQGGIHHRPYKSERPWFRNIRGIRDEIHDLQLVQPSAGLQYLIASGNDHTYVIDQSFKVSTLPPGGRKVLIDPKNPSIFYTGNYDFHGFQYNNGKWEEVLKVEIQKQINQMCLDTYSYVWISTRDGLRRLDASRGQNMEVSSYNSDQGLPEEENLKVFKDPLNQELLVGSSHGFYHFDYLNNRFSPDTAYNSILPEGRNSIRTVHKAANGLYWFSFDNDFRGWVTLAARLTAGGFQNMYDRAFRALSPRAPTDVFYTDSRDQLWFSKSNELFHFDESQVRDTKDSFDVLMRRVSILGDSILFNGSNYLLDPSGQIQPHTEQTESAQPRLKHIYRDVSFDWSAPYYTQENRIRYSYFLEGFSSEWSDWSWARSAKINNLKHGRYVMQVKARNAYGEESPAAQYAFIILRPWYATLTAIFIYIILITSLVVFVILYTRSLKSRAELLERQNKEIELQRSKLESLNEEITSQRDEIEAQRDSISNQNELIDSQNRAMTDSIHYARRIQDAVMPAPEVMRYLLPKHFVFYKPRDIVSGDFFWVDKRDETVLIAVADCTGHGVPGAFMSMLGISLLNEISSKYGNQPTNELMDELRDQLIAALGQTGDKYEARDGMEMALVAINTKTREIQFTGASQHLYTFQKGELVVIKGDRMPVGIHAMSSTLFSSHTLKLSRGDSLYLFSDGYVDQFGGEHRKKYGSARLKTLLTELQQNIMHDQKEDIEKEFDNWKGKQEQIDDVLMIGIKL